MRISALTSILALSLNLLIQIPAWGQIGWHHNLRQGHAQAEQEDKLLLLHFYSDNCVWCDKLEAGAFRAQEVGQAINHSFVPVKINASANPELAEMFKVTKFPTDVVVTTTGKKLTHQVSPQDPAKYVAMLTKTLPPDAPQTDQIAAAQPQAPQTGVPDTAAADQVLPAGQPSNAPEISLPQSVDATLASARPDDNEQSRATGFRENDLTLQMPEKIETPTAPTTPPAETVTSSDPELAMEGFCAVTVITDDKWVEGKPEFGVIHLGKLYLFESEQAMNTFLGDPVPYTPVLNEVDVVRFFEERKIVPGKREWGVKDPNYQRMFFFADEAAMNHFIEEHHRYTDAAVEVMEQAVKDSNPES